MTHKYTFRAVIEDAGEGGAFVAVPFDVEKAFGKKRVKVKASIAGEPYRGSLVRMGTDCHILGIRKDIRQKIGKTIGDEIEIEIEEDTEPRVADLPADVSLALENHPAAKAFFLKLSYTHQKEYIQWIEEARTGQTRQKRLTQMLAQLTEGQKSR